MPKAYRWNLVCKTTLFLLCLILWAGCSEQSNQAPVISSMSVSPQSAGVGDYVQLVAVAIDANANDTLVYAWSTTGNQGTFTDASARVTNWLAQVTGDFEFSLTVGDGQPSTTATANITVGEPSIGSNPSTGPRRDSVRPKARASR